MRNVAVAAFLFVLSFAARAQGYAIVIQDETPLRTTPGTAERPSAMLWQGETLEVRGERLDYLQVWDYTRERGGYVRASQLRRLELSAREAPELLAVLRFLRGVPGEEALGIGIAASYIEAAPPEALDGPDGVEALDAMGAMAERLARGANAASLAKATAISAHLDVAARYGVRFFTFERNGRLRLCYDGAAYRKVLELHATEEQRTRAMLALSEPACTKPELTVAEMLDKADDAALAPYLRNRVLMRRAAVWSSLAYQRARKSGNAEAAAERAIAALAQINLSELAETDRLALGETELRVGAVRIAFARPSPSDRSIHVAAAPGEKEGQTCIALKNKKDETLARRCTYGHVWTASAVANASSTALTVAVQPTDSWRELWLFRKTKSGWTVRVVAPAAVTPGVGTVEFAGWAPGGVRVLREAVVGGRVIRTSQRLRT